MANLHLPPLIPLSPICHPTLRWRQDFDKVTLVIELTDVKAISLRIVDNELLFWTELNGKKYVLLLDLFAEILPADSTHEILGSSIRIRLRKKKQDGWSRLVSSSDKIPYIKADFDDDNDISFETIRKQLPPVKSSEQIDFYGRCLPPEAVKDFDNGFSSDDDLKNLETDDSSLDSDEDENLLE